LNAALSLAATVLGRCYCGETKLRTNLYLVSIGTTGSGKEHPREAIRCILNAADCDYLDGGENITSGQYTEVWNAEGNPPACISCA